MQYPKLDHLPLFSEMRRETKYASHQNIFRFASPNLWLRSNFKMYFFPLIYILTLHLHNKFVLLTLMDW